MFEYGIKENKRKDPVLYNLPVIVTAFLLFGVVGLTLNSSGATNLSDVLKLSTVSAAERTTR